MKIHCLIENTRSGPELVAEHGLSLLIETGSHRILFDAGASPAFAENAARMGLDLGRVDAAVLSHGHYDHGGGMLRFLELNPHSPVWASPHAAEPHFNAEGKDIGLPAELARHKRFRPVSSAVSELAPGITLHTAGTVPQAYPTPPNGMSTLRGNSHIPDDFRHELYLLIEENGRRVLFSGCSHRGILNITDHFRPDILVGGFHLMRTPLQELPAVAYALAQFHTHYYTGHCTGAPAFNFLKSTLREHLDSFSSGSSIEICL